MLNSLRAQGPTTVNRNWFASKVAEHEAFKDVPETQLSADQCTCLNDLRRHAAFVRRKAHGLDNGAAPSKADPQYAIAALYAVEQHCPDVPPNSAREFLTGLLHWHQSKRHLTPKQLDSLIRSRPVEYFEPLEHGDGSLGFQPYLDLYDKAMELKQPKARTKAQNSERAEQKRSANRQLREVAVMREHSGKLREEWGTRPPEELAAECARRIVAANEAAPTLFVMGSKLVAVTTDTSSGKATATQVTADHMQRRLADVVALTRPSLRDEPSYMVAPRPLCNFVIGDLQSTLPGLDALASVPFFDADGNIVAKSGYHAPSRTFLATQRFDALHHRQHCS